MIGNEPSNNKRKEKKEKSQFRVNHVSIEDFMRNQIKFLDPNGPTIRSF